MTFYFNLFHFFLFFLFLFLFWRGGVVQDLPVCQHSSSIRHRTPTVGPGKRKRLLGLRQVGGGHNYPSHACDQKGSQISVQVGGRISHTTRGRQNDKKVR
jgi:hypothetical protein